MPVTKVGNVITETAPTQGARADRTDVHESGAFAICDNQDVLKQLQFDASQLNTNATMVIQAAAGSGGTVILPQGTVAVNPMTTLGDSIYGGASGAVTRLAGNTTATKNFLVQTGNGTISAAPAWGTIASGDVPALTFTGDVTGTQGATVVSLVGASSAANVHTAELLANAATNNSTASTIVKRASDSSANFSALYLDSGEPFINIAPGGGYPGNPTGGGIRVFAETSLGASLAVVTANNQVLIFDANAISQTIRFKVTNQASGGTVVTTNGETMAGNFAMGGNSITGAAAVSTAIVQNTASQTTLTGSVGTAICSQPEQGSSYKKVAVFLNGYTDTGTQTFTFPVAFVKAPYVYGLASGVAGATTTTSSIKFTVTTLTGFVFAEGY